MNVFRRIEEMQAKWDSGKFMNILESDDSLEISKIQKKKLIENLEYAIDQGYQLPVNIESFILNKLTNVFKVSNDYSQMTMIGKKEHNFDTQVNNQNLKKVNQGYKLYSSKQELIKPLFLSDHKKKQQLPFPKQLNQTIIEETIDLFPEMYHNNDVIFQLQSVQVLFNKVNIPVSLFTSQNNNHNKLLSRRIKHPKADLRLSRIKPLEVEDILGILEDQVRKYDQRYNYFMGGWFDLTQFSSEINHLQNKSNINLSSKFNLSPFKMNKNRMLPNQQKIENIICPSSGVENGEEQTKKLVHDSLKSSMNSDMKINTIFVQKLFSLPNKCCFQEEIHLDEKKCYTLLIMRHDDVPPNLRKFINFQPVNCLKNQVKKQQPSKIILENQLNSLETSNIINSQIETNKIGYSNLEQRIEKKYQTPSQMMKKKNTQMNLKSESDLTENSDKHKADSSNSFSQSKSSTFMKKGCYINSSIYQKNSTEKPHQNQKMIKAIKGKSESSELTNRFPKKIA
jgi:hypothetical protein